MKKNLFLAAFTLGAAALASTLLPAPAKATDPPIEANVEIELQIPSFVFLQTYKKLIFKPNLEDVTNEGSVGKFQTQDGNIVGSSYTPTEGLTDPSASSTSTYKPKLEYTDVPVYKVWGTSENDKKIYHKVTVSKATLTKDSGTDEITMTVTGDSVDKDALLADGATTYGNAETGNLTFTFNLGSTPKSGTYTGGIVTITAYTQ